MTFTIAVLMIKILSMLLRISIFMVIVMTEQGIMTIRRIAILLMTSYETIIGEWYDMILDKYHSNWQVENIDKLEVSKTFSDSFAYDGTTNFTDDLHLPQ